MSVSTDLRSWLMETLGNEYEYAGKVQQNNTEQGTEFPYVWFQRSGDVTERCIDGAPIQRTIDYDLECVSNDLDESLALAAAIKSELDGHQGTLGSGSGAVEAWEVIVADHTDDYLPQNIDEGRHVASLRITIITP